MKILVTGSRGFVGGSVGRFAARAGHEVLGIARSGQPAPGWPGGHVSADAAHSDLAPVLQDFAPEAIVHCAGAASVGASLVSPLDDLRAALLTWANTLDAVRRWRSAGSGPAGPGPVILFPSSAAVYGDPAALPVPESAPVAPISPYGFHKAACELLAREYAVCFDLDIVVCRLFSVYGPAQRRLLVWEMFQQMVSEGDTVWLRGTGEETRDYLFVEDAAAAFLQLIAQARGRAGREERGACAIVNVAGGEEVRVLDLAYRLRALVAPHKRIECRRERSAGDPGRWGADIAALRARIGGDWRPRTLDEGLRECVAAWETGRETAVHAGR